MTTKYADLSSEDLTYVEVNSLEVHDELRTEIISRIADIEGQLKAHFEPRLRRGPDGALGTVVETQREYDEWARRSRSAMTHLRAKLSALKADRARLGGGRMPVTDGLLAEIRDILARIETALTTRRTS